MPEREVDKLYALPKGTNDSTFRLDPVLPSLPLPPLDVTLKKYLESVKPFVTPEELAHTEKLVKEFQNGAGKVLHQKLSEKASKSRNWVSYWIFRMLLIQL